MNSKTKSQNATKFSKAKLATLADQTLTKKFSAAGQPAGITSTMLGENVYNPQTTTDPFSISHFSPNKMHELENDDRSSSISDTDDSYPQLKGDKLGAKPAPGKKTRGRVKIQMEYIQNKLRRYTTFSKRKSGIMKKVSLRSRQQNNAKSASVDCNLLFYFSGLRVEHSDGDTSDAACRFGDWPCLHLCYSQAAANDHLGDWQGSHPDLSAPA